MTRRLLLAPVLALALALAGCAGASDTGSTPAGAGASATVAPAHEGSGHKRSAHQHHAARKPKPKPKPRRPAPKRSAAAGLAYSTASGDQVQPQPAAGSCRATGSGLFSAPDRRCSPGALNPAVTQATINSTICVSGYTKTIRPAESITEDEKRSSMDAYDDTDAMSAYEYDHIVSLELGGAVNDPRNLWPEPGASPNPKDSVENDLHRLVCDGQMPLAQAQHIIATGWAAWYHAHIGSTPHSGAPRTTSTMSRAPAPSSSGSGPNKPVSEVNCSDFATHAAAQAWFTGHGGSTSNDVAGLDGDHDGIACESLP